MSQSIAHEVQAHRQTDRDIDPMYLNRWSPRSFADKDVPEDVLLTILEAARWSPSGGNMQPSRYIVARTPEDRAKFHTFINEGNREWCEKAPVLLVLISNKLTGNGNFYRSHSFDAGTSWGYLALEAARQGLFAHAMGGFDTELARNTLNVPEDYEINIVIALGYRGERASFPRSSRNARSLPTANR